MIGSRAAKASVDYSNSNSIEDASEDDDLRISNAESRYFDDPDSNRNGAGTNDQQTDWNDCFFDPVTESNYLSKEC